MTDMEIGWVAWGVGLLTGYTTRVAGRGISNEMGFCAAVAALVAILLGQFLAMRHAVNSFKEEFIGIGYEESVEYGKRAAKATTDLQIRNFLAAEFSDDMATVSPSEITREQIDEFKKELPKFKRMAAGQYSKADYERENRSSMDEVLSTGFILRNSFSLWTLLWIFLGVGSAYRLASGG